jgi:hypothetical protein
LQAGGHRFDPGYLHQKRENEIAAFDAASRGSSILRVETRRTRITARAVVVILRGRDVFFDN